MLTFQAKKGLYMRFRGIPETGMNGWRCTVTRPPKRRCSTQSANLCSNSEPAHGTPFTTLPKDLISFYNTTTQKLFTFYTFV